MQNLAWDGKLLLSVLKTFLVEISGSLISPFLIYVLLQNETVHCCGFQGNLRHLISPHIIAPQNSQEEVSHCARAPLNPQLPFPVKDPYYLRCVDISAALS